MKTLRLIGFAVAGLIGVPANALAGLQAGAAMIDITPKQFPVMVNGGMFANRATQSTSPLHARAIVLDDGRETVAIVVVDSCMLPRPLLDDVKDQIAGRSKIRRDRILISATHTHSAPAAMGCLGTDADPTYVPFLKSRLVEVVLAALAKLEPAKVGWAVTDAAAYTAVRRWIIRPDRIANDPFGNPTVRANMHAGRIWDNVTGESGPKDPELSLISIQALDGRPIALLANFSMHYFSGVIPVNADYFGLFCDGIQRRLAHKADTGKQQQFVALMSHGCSGDIWRWDYTKPANAKEHQITIEKYTEGLIDLAVDAYRTIEHRADVDLAMAERRMTMAYRVPDKQRLEWAERIVTAMGDRPPKTQEEVYAREQIFLDQRKSTEIVVQALRIGSIAIATTPTETYALTGLKLKWQSPLPQTMVIELANGGDGYIPPPEQHHLGGYNTWPARSAGLEVLAEPKIVEAALELLEQVADRPRRRYQQSRGPAAQAILDLKPLAYWRLDEFGGHRARDASGNRHDGYVEPGVVFFLEGPHSTAFCQNGEVNRASHFAGGRLETTIPQLGTRYTVSLWFWNGMPNDGRETAGWIFSRGHNHGLGPASDHVGVGGTATEPGKLIYLNGSDRDAAKPLIGRTILQRWTWNHLLFVRDGTTVRIYLNGQATPEITSITPERQVPSVETLFFGGRTDNRYNWEGRLDEIAVFDRPLDPEELKKLSIR